MTLKEALFFEGKPEALALYEALTQAMEAALPPYTVTVQKTQISFANRHGFAFVSLRGGLVVTFGLSRRVEDARVWQAVEPYPGRWTHHVRLGDAAQVDAQLLGWLREAWAFAEAKGRKKRSP